jgi:hypothetical protein
MTDTILEAKALQEEARMLRAAFRSIQREPAAIRQISGAKCGFTPSVAQDIRSATAAPHPTRLSLS